MNDLLSQAICARLNAYAPYSGFAVGAALRLSNGEIFTGANIENASYGLTNCAERTAVFKAVSEGKRDIVEIVIVADTLHPVSPCGMCRQVFVEFCKPDTPVWLANLRGDQKRLTVQDLLPFAFEKGDLHG